MLRAVVFTSLIVASMSGPAWAQSQPPRSVGAHVHGQAEISIVISGDEVTAELHSPLHNILGFERAPRSDMEKAAVATAKTALNGGASILSLPADAQCRQTAADVRFPDFGHGDHGHHAESDHKHQHMDVEAAYTFKCADAGRLSNATIEAFKSFTGIETAEVIILGKTSQTSRKITAASPVVSLR